MAPPIHPSAPRDKNSGFSTPQDSKGLNQAQSPLQNTQNTHAVAQTAIPPLNADSLENRSQSTPVSKLTETAAEPGSVRITREGALNKENEVVQQTIAQLKAMPAALNCHHLIAPALSHLEALQALQQDMSLNGRSERTEKFRQTMRLILKGPIKDPAELRQALQSVQEFSQKYGSELQATLAALSALKQSLEAVRAQNPNLAATVANDLARLGSAILTLETEVQLANSAFWKAPCDQSAPWGFVNGLQQVTELSAPFDPQDKRQFEARYQQITALRSGVRSEHNQLSTLMGNHNTPLVALTRTLLLEQAVITEGVYLNYANKNQKLETRALLKTHPLLMQRLEALQTLLQKYRQGDLSEDFMKASLNQLGAHLQEVRRLTQSLSEQKKLLEKEYAELTTQAQILRQSGKQPLTMADIQLLDRCQVVTGALQHLDTAMKQLEAVARQISPLKRAPAHFAVKLIEFEKGWPQPLLSEEERAGLKAGKPEAIEQALRKYIYATRFKAFKLKDGATPVFLFKTSDEELFTKLRNGTLTVLEMQTAFTQLYAHIEQTQSQLMELALRYFAATGQAELVKKYSIPTEYHILFNKSAAQAYKQDELITKLASFQSWSRRAVPLILQEFYQQVPGAAGQPERALRDLLSLMEGGGGIDTAQAKSVARTFEQNEYLTEADLNALIQHLRSQPYQGYAPLLSKGDLEKIVQGSTANIVLRTAAQKLLTHPQAFEALRGMDRYEGHSCISLHGLEYWKVQVGNSSRQSFSGVEPQSAIPLFSLRAEVTTIAEEMLRHMPSLSARDLLAHASERSEAYRVWTAGYQSLVRLGKTDAEREQLVRVLMMELSRLSKNHPQTYGLSPQEVVGDAAAFALLNRFVGVERGELKKLLLLGACNKKERVDYILYNQGHHTPSEHSFIRIREDEQKAGAVLTPEQYISRFQSFTAPYAQNLNALQKAGGSFLKEHGYLLEQLQQYVRDDIPALIQAYKKAVQFQKNMGGKDSLNGLESDKPQQRLLVQIAEKLAELEERYIALMMAKPEFDATFRRTMTTIAKPTVMTFAALGAAATFLPSAGQSVWGLVAAFGATSTWGTLLGTAAGVGIDAAIDHSTHQRHQINWGDNFTQALTTSISAAIPLATSQLLPRLIARSIGVSAMASSGEVAMRMTAWTAANPVEHAIIQGLNLGGSNVASAIAGQAVHHTMGNAGIAAKQQQENHSLFRELLRSGASGFLLGSLGGVFHKLGAVGAEALNMGIPIAEEGLWQAVVEGNSDPYEMAHSMAAAGIGNLANVIALRNFHEKLKSEQQRAVQEFAQNNIAHPAIQSAAQGDRSLTESFRIAKENIEIKRQSGDLDAKTAGQYLAEIERFEARHRIGKLPPEVADAIQEAHDEPNLKSKYKIIRDKGKITNKVAVQALLQGASGVRLPNPLALEPYHPILEHGIRTEADIHSALKLLADIDPEFAQLVEKTKTVQFVFEAPDESGTQIGRVVAGTDITSADYVDRTRPQTKSRITLSYTQGPKGIPITALLHELIHAASFTDLPEFYRVNDIPKISETGNVSDNYRAILNNRFIDEGMAMAAMLRFQEKFQKSTGKKLEIYPAETAVLQDVQARFGKSYAANGIMGIAQKLWDDPPYAHYKQSALYLTVMLKQGMKVEHIPSWESLMDASGIKEADGTITRDPVKMKAFFENFLKPLLNQHAADLLLTAAGLSAKESELLLKAAQYFQGRMSPKEAADFLMKDFDHLVDSLGLIMGDKKPEVRRTIKASDYEGLPVLQNKPVVQGDPSEIQKRPQVVADQVEIVGKYVDLLQKFDSSSDQVVFEQGRLFMNYAQAADPVAASRVYSRLIKVLEKTINSVPAPSSRERERHETFAYELGLSLHKSGYHQEAQKLFKLGLSLFPDNNLAQGQTIHPPSVSFRELIEQGFGDVVEQYLDKYLVTCEEGLTASLQMAHHAQSDMLNGKFPHEAPDQLIRLLLRIESDFPHEKTPSMNKKLERIIEQLWSLAKIGMDAKIKLYQRLHASQQNFISIEELTADFVSQHQTQSGPTSRILGTTGATDLSRGNNLFSPAGLIDVCLQKPGLFAQGLRLLSEFPQSYAKLELFQIAAENMPKDTPAAVRERFAEDYQKTLHSQEPTLKANHYIELINGETPSELKDEAKRKAPASGTRFETTHLFFMHTQRIAEALFKSGDSKLQAKAQKLLLSLPNEPGAFFNVYAKDSSNKRTHFEPQLERAEALLANLEHFSPQLRPKILKDIYNSLVEAKAPSAIGSDLFKQARVLLDFVKQATRLGGHEIAGVLAEWKSNIQARLEKEVPKLSNSHREEELKNAAILDRALVLLPLCEALSNQGKGLDTLTDRIAQDVELGRQRFTVPSLIEGLKFLSLPEMKSRVAGLEPTIERMARCVIELYIKSLGKEHTSPTSSSEWEPLAQMLGELPLPASMKDKLFVDLIEWGTLRAGTMLHGDAKSGLYGALDGLKTLSFLIGNPDYPLGEAALLSRTSQLLDKIQFNTQDPRAKGAAMGLGWLFKRLATTTLLDPGQHSLLAGLRDTPQYRSLYQALQQYQSVHKKALADTAVTDPKVYQALVKTGDAKQLSARTSELKSVISRELNDLMTDNGLVSNIVIGYTPSALNNMMVGQVYKRWLTACHQGNHALAQALFPIWAHSANEGHVQAKQWLYHEVMADPRVPLESKRQVFQELRKIDSISAYKKKIWEDLVKGHDREKEALFYTLIAAQRRPTNEHKTYLSETPDALLAHAMSLPTAEARNLVKRVERGLQASAQNQSASINELDPLDWEVNAYQNGNLKQGLLYRFAALAVIKNGRWTDIQNNLREIAILEKEKAQAPDVDSVNTLNRKIWDLRDKNIEMMSDCYEKEAALHLQSSVRKKSYFNLRTDMGFVLTQLEKSSAHVSSGQAEAALKKFQSLFTQHNKFEDTVKGATLQLPALFQDRDPLTQFLLSRFYFQLSSGEQQNLMRKMEHASKAEALRLFFENTGLEKVGQFLSFWPEVPADIRAELSHLQSKVPPSDFNEVKETVTRGLQEQLQSAGLSQENYQSILKHLNPKPLGSGSIGEAYESRLADGTPVVVKVRTPSKESRFKEALQKVKAVRPLADLHVDDLPGAREASRLLEMFENLVERELDFKEEADNQTLFLDHLPNGIGIPKNFYATHNLLIQQKVPGKPLSDIKDPKIRKQVMDKIREHFMATQILQQGIYHSDLQPGNIIYDEATGKIWLIDFGQIGVLETKEQEALLQFILATQSRNAALALASLENMGVKQPNYNPAELAQSIASLMPASGAPTENISQVITPLFRACQKAGLLIDLSFLKLLKGVSTFEATAR